MLLSSLTESQPSLFQIEYELHEELNTILWDPSVWQHAEVVYRFPWLVIRIRRWYYCPSYSAFAPVRHIKVPLRWVLLDRKPNRNGKVNAMTIRLPLVGNLQYIWLQLLFR